jgi:hypothetical protein
LAGVGSSNPFDEPTARGLHPGEIADSAVNPATQIVHLDDGPHAPFAQVFQRAFSKISRLIESFPGDGVLAVGVWGNRTVDAYLHVPVGPEPRYAIIGRHRECDLQLPQDEGVSLRHVVLRCARRGNTDVRIRLWDLASGVGFTTEDGEVGEALVCEGPVFVRLGSYHLFLIPTGALSVAHWGSDPDETWASFPERVFLDHRIPTRSKPTAESPAPRIAAGKSHRVGNLERHSIITQIVPPARPLRRKQRHHAPDGDPVGTLRLANAEEELSFPVTDKDLDHGLLVGRYARCDLGGDEKRLSRIHMLIVRDEDGVWAIDTASSNGTRRDDADIRAVRLDGATELVLANVLTLRWEPRLGHA